MKRSKPHAGTSNTGSAGRVWSRERSSTWDGICIHSLCFHKLGARRVVSIDVDRNSVEATRSLHASAGRPWNWEVHEGSILDERFIGGLGTFDTVYSWGVLHHTAACGKPSPRRRIMTRARNLGGAVCQRSSVRGRPGAQATLQRGVTAGEEDDDWTAGGSPDGSARSTGSKSAPMECAEGARDGHLPRHCRLGRGLPYEVASRQETVDFLQKRGFVLRKIEEHPERCNNIYLFSKT